MKLKKKISFAEFCNNERGISSKIQGIPAEILPEVVTKRAWGEQWIFFLTPAPKLAQLIRGAPQRFFPWALPQLCPFCRGHISCPEGSLSVSWCISQLQNLVEQKHFFCCIVYIWRSSITFKMLIFLSRQYFFLTRIKKWSCKYLIFFFKGTFSFCLFSFSFRWFVGFGFGFFF